MNCTRCGWPTPIGERDLMTGVCAECRSIQAESAGIGPEEGRVRALSRHAARRLARGEHPGTLQEALRAAGMDAPAAAAVVREATERQAAVQLAQDMLDHGAGAYQVRTRLVADGLTAEAAAGVIEEAQQRRSGFSADGAPSRRTRKEDGPSRVVLVSIGLLVFAVLSLAGGALALTHPGAIGFGYLLGWAGQVWLLYLIFRECPSDAVALALFVPFFTWYFAFQRLDIAKVPLALSVIGFVSALFGSV